MKNLQNETNRAHNSDYPISIRLALTNRVGTVFFRTDIRK